MWLLGRLGKGGASRYKHITITLINKLIKFEAEVATATAAAAHADAADDDDWDDDDNDDENDDDAVTDAATASATAILPLIKRVDKCARHLSRQAIRTELKSCPSSLQIHGSDSLI